jgi:hypothetical protein
VRQWISFPAVLFSVFLRLSLSAQDFLFPCSSQLPTSRPCHPRFLTVHPYCNLTTQHQLGAFQPQEAGGFVCMESTCYQLTFQTHLYKLAAGHIDFIYAHDLSIYTAPQCMFEFGLAVLHVISVHNESVQYRLVSLSSSDYYCRRSTGFSIKHVFI